MITRIYPTRVTKIKWDIPLFCHHICNEYCNFIYISDTNNQLILQESEIKCQYNNKLKKTFVRLSTFDINNPLGDSGKLYNPNVKIIPDNSFSVNIYFPLSFEFEVFINAPSSNGFTLKELLYSLKILYEFIYSEEERTSNLYVYNLKKICSLCGNKDLSLCMENLENLENLENVEDTCCICYNEYDSEEKPSRLKCGHIFHNSCITKWLKTSGTCPICRNHIFICGKCDGIGIIYYSINTVVIPLEHRGNTLNRNPTDGIFGIHSHDLEDLVIEKLTYNRIDKKLYMIVSG